MILSVCLIAWGYSRVLRYAVFTVDVVLMWGQKLSVAMQLKRRPPQAVQVVELRAKIIL